MNEESTLTANDVDYEFDCKDPAFNKSLHNYNYEIVRAINQRFEIRVTRSWNHTEVGVAVGSTRDKANRKAMQLAMIDIEHIIVNQRDFDVRGLTLED